MSKKYRVAVIGATGRGNYGHGLDEAFQGVEGTELVAVADAKGLAAASAKSAARPRRPRVGKVLSTAVKTGNKALVRENKTGAAFSVRSVKNGRGRVRDLAGGQRIPLPLADRTHPLVG